MIQTFRQEAAALILQLLSDSLGLHATPFNRPADAPARIPDGTEGGDAEFKLSIAMSNWAVATGLGVNGPMIPQIARALEAHVRNHSAVGKPDPFVRDHWTNKVGRQQAPQAIHENAGWFLIIYSSAAEMTIVFPCKVSSIVLR